MFGLGAPELLIILAILLLVLGPKRLPRLGRSIGGGVRNFRRSLDAKDAKTEAEAEQEAAKPPAEVSAGPPAV